MTLTGWGNTYESDAQLVTQSWENLKYFTVLSNLLSGIASAIYIFFTLREKSGNLPGPVATLKLAGTTSVALTFFTVVVLFRLLWGLHGLFMGANLWYHLVLPIAAMISTAVFETNLTFKLRDAFVATIPMVLYGAAYYVNIVLNGMGEGPNSNDWYGLAAAGLQWAPVVFVTMFAGTFVMALALYCVHNKCTN